MIMRTGFTLVCVVVAAACAAPSSVPPGEDSTPPVSLTTLVDVPLAVDVTDGLVGTSNFSGQSVTVPAGRFDNIRFAWYRSHPRGQITAFGRLYVLDREYLGSPVGLSESTPGYLARSEPVTPSTSGDGTEYVLPADLVLEGGRQYWFYTDTQGAFAYSFDRDIYAGGTQYVTGMPNLAFRISQASGRMVNGVFVPGPAGVTNDTNFRLRGTPR
jgi:hypothetical protein